MNKRLRISACMMVKNEEENLDRCLGSIKRFVDEIVVVDTGSTDRTIAIARAHGAKVYEHPWEYDFSAHRNQSIGYATGDWILIIDADEELVLDVAISKIKDTMATLDDELDCLILDVRDIQDGKISMEFQSSRLFRRGRVYYEGIVHNWPKTPHNRGAFVNGLWVKHYGYDLTPEHKKRKFERTSGLLFRRLEKNPDDWPCYFYLCQLYADNEIQDDSIAWGERYLAFEDREAFNDSIYYCLFCRYITKKDYQAAGRILRRGLARIPEDLDLNHGLVELGLATMTTEFIYRGAGNFMKIYSQYVKDPRRKEKRFIFTLKPEAIGMIRGALVVAHFEDGTKYLKDLEKMDLPADFRANLIQTLQGALGAMEIPIGIETTNNKPAHAAAH